MARTPILKSPTLTQVRAQDIAHRCGSNMRTALREASTLLQAMEEDLDSASLIRREGVITQAQEIKAILSYAIAQYLQTHPDVAAYRQFKITLSQKARSLHRYQLKYDSRRDDDPEKKKFAAKIRSKEAELILLRQKQAEMEENRA